MRIRTRNSYGAKPRCWGVRRYRDGYTRIGSYPGMRPARDPKDLITGELYELHQPSKTLEVLDEWEEEYDRQLHPATLDNGQEVPGVGLRVPSEPSRGSLYCVGGVAVKVGSAFQGRGRASPGFIVFIKIAGWKADGRLESLTHHQLEKGDTSQLPQSQ